MEWWNYLYLNEGLPCRCYQNSVLMSLRPGFATLVGYPRIYSKHILTLFCADG